MNWNKPENTIINYHPFFTRVQILEQWQVDQDFHFFAWRGLGEVCDGPMSYTVAIWMPKGLKQRNNG